LAKDADCTLLEMIFGASLSDGWSEAMPVRGIDCGEMIAATNQLNLFSAAS